MEWNDYLYASPHEALRSLPMLAIPTCAGNGCYILTNAKILLGAKTVKTERLKTYLCIEESAAYLRKLPTTLRNCVRAGKTGEFRRHVTNYWLNNKMSLDQQVRRAGYPYK